MTFKTYLNTTERKGYLKYEYNPFHNYQTDVDLYEVNTDIGPVLVPKGKAAKISTGEILTEKAGYWVDKNGNIIGQKYIYKVFNIQPSKTGWYLNGEKVSILPDGIPANPTDGQVYYEGIIEPNDKLYAQSGSLMNFDTSQFNFDLQHPVDITVQPSYDGSVNLILNDGKNIPRLINSRFSAREKNTYEIVDRIGENDTNIYNSADFDKDTSLYFRYSTSPKIKFIKHIGGNLPVGQYCFYFTYCDADDNESDIIAESGLIPTFIGSNKDPFSMDGGIKNQNSNKGIELELNNLDKSYNYIKVYQFRYFADYQQNRVYECKKLYHKYPLESTMLFLNITGNEDGEMIDPNLLNISTFNPKSVLTQAQCKNMLFFGNIVKNTDNYKELTDCALRIYPELQFSTISSIDNNYTDVTGDYGYYNVDNIYNKVGYFPGEYYRFGVVFIYANGTLSNVYNTIGYDYNTSRKLIYQEKNIYEQVSDPSGIPLLERKYIDFDDEGWIIDSNNIYSQKPYYCNSKGVLKIDIANLAVNTIIGIKFNIHQEVISHLQTLGIVGMFFVRQKRVPTILAQCYLLPMDELLCAPLIKLGDGIQEHPTYYSECFLQKEDRALNNEEDAYLNRLRLYNNKSVAKNKSYAAICPDFLLNQPYYNQIFNGNKFKVQKITNDDRLIRDSKNPRKYTCDLEANNGFFNVKQQVKICTVTEDVPTVAIQDKKYKLNIGVAEEAYRFGFAEIDTSSEKVEEQTNLVRGIYSPYLAIYSESVLSTGCLYNIYTDEEVDIRQQFLDRMNSSDAFYAIGDRNNFDNLTKKEDNNNYYYTNLCYRGDCYLNTFTYRLNRNFNDPSLPNNDEILQKGTWKDNYTATYNKENWENISRSDVNAVKLGSWITIKCRSDMNYALRSNDGSFVSENAIMGSERSFYPRSSLMEAGENKRPDSYLYNDAYRATLGYKCYFTLDNVNYLKDNFSNRIQYSSIAIQDSYKNNFRHSLTTYFRDYSQEYGSIQKLVGFEGYLLVVFEHAVCIAVINERILAGQSDGEPVFINAKNVLPEELTVISDTYGTQWPESVIKSEAGYVYGVDTIQKKIWRVKSQQIEILSDFKVNKFLIDNITLGERETYPIIGLRNVKTHYNNNKKDIMFTFYDDVYKDEEKVWNLCFNEMLDQFITFYSWVPSYSENIDTQYFSFDRNTSKYLSLLNKCNANVPENTGILLDNPIINPFSNKREFKETVSIGLQYRSIGIEYIDKEKDGILYHESSIKENNDISGYDLEHDHWGNWKFVQSISNSQLVLKDIYDLYYNVLYDRHVLLLELTPYSISENNIKLYYPTETIVITTIDNINGYIPSQSEESEEENEEESQEPTTEPKLEPTVEPFTTDFYLHGNSGIIDCQEQLYPTHWYGEFHPFEFEFAVNDKIAQQKIFTNLIIISNKAEPQSFHFEIEGDNYEFSNDKRTMYFRQEATKNLYQNLGSDMLYNRKFTDIVAGKYTNEQYYRGNPKIRDYNEIPSNKENEYLDQYRKFDRVYPIDSQGLVQQIKSTIFPLYYEKVDTYNDIYYKYRGMLDDIDDSGYDFKNLSGSEIVWHRRQNQFNIVTHIKNSPIDLVGRMRGNSRYKEGKWNVQIPSITFMQKNEQPWSDTWNGGDSPINKFDNFGKIPPLVINSSNIPNDITSGQITYSKLPNIYINNNDKYNSQWPRFIDNKPGWTARKETKMRDKWIKIRVRYSGKNLAVIHSLVTLYNISYS